MLSHFLRIICDVEVYTDSSSNSDRTIEKTGFTVEMETFYFLGIQKLNNQHYGLSYMYHNNKMYKENIP